MLDVHRSGNSWWLAGSLDAEGGSALLRELRDAPNDVRIDGSGLQQIDGAGLTALAIARQECRAVGRTFAVVEVAPDALRHLRVGDRLLELFGPPHADTPTAEPAPPDDPDHAAPGHAESAHQRGSHRSLHVHLHLRRRHDGTPR